MKLYMWLSIGQSMCIAASSTNPGPAVTAAAASGCKLYDGSEL
jgi:hypothetical protein